jgi:hypothetical protein
VWQVSQTFDSRIGLISWIALEEEGSVNRCWVLIVTRGLKVWLPPELYLSRDLAAREAVRWHAILRLPVDAPHYSSSARYLHLVESMFPEPWRACPVWVGVSWHVHSFPRPKIELMAADTQEANEWLKRRTPKGIDMGKSGQVQFERRGRLASVGVFRVKRVMGF